MPAPELRPRELPQLERVYSLLAPTQHQPVAVFIVSAVTPAAVGSLSFTAVALCAGLVYNLFATVTGGIDCEVTPVAILCTPDGAGRAIELGVTTQADPDQLE